MAQEGGESYLYRRPQDGGQTIKVTTRPVVRFETISPDGKWLVAEAPIGGEDITRGVLAFNIDNGTIKRICYSLCIVRWTQDGKSLYVGLPGSAENSALFKTFIVPLKQGAVFPDLPVAGIKTETDLMGWRGVKIVNDSVHPGPDISRYAYDHTSDHRNIYRVPIR